MKFLERHKRLIEKQSRKKIAEILAADSARRVALGKRPWELPGWDPPPPHESSFTPEEKLKLLSMALASAYDEHAKVPRPQ